MLVSPLSPIRTEENCYHMFFRVFAEKQTCIDNSHHSPGSTKKGERACYFPWIRSALAQREYRRTRNKDYNGVTRHRSRPRTLRLLRPQKTTPRLPASPYTHRKAR